MKLNPILDTFPAMQNPAFPEFNMLTDSRHGRMIYNKNDVYIGKCFELYGEFSYGECQIFDAIVQPGMTIVEVGANIGSHTVSIAQKTGPQGTVHAFEPQRIVFQTLCANLAINQLTNVITHYAAAGDQPGTLVVPELDPKSTQNFGGLGLGNHHSGQAVPVVTIDSLNLSSCEFIKADVEGMEESALRGAENTIKQFLPMLYVENDRQEKAFELTSYISSLGYRMFLHRPHLYNPENFKGNKENVFQNIVSSNLFCIHRSKPASISGMPEVTV